MKYLRLATNEEVHHGITTITIFFSCGPVPAYDKSSGTLTDRPAGSFPGHHRLEAELGVPLFERKNRSIELNDEGKFLQKRLIPILSSLDRLPEELRKGKEAATHTVHLRLLSASALITNRIHCLQKSPPGCKFPAVPDTRTGR